MTIEEEYLKAQKRCGNQCEWVEDGSRCGIKHCLRASYKTKSKVDREQNILFLCPKHYQENEGALRPVKRVKKKKGDLDQIEMFNF